MATKEIAPIIEGKNPKFVFCVAALAINTVLPTTALVNRHIYNLGHTTTNDSGSRRTLSHTSAINATNHYITVPNTGYYEVSFQFSAFIHTKLTEVAMCKNWIQQNNTSVVCPVANRVLYINCPQDPSVTGRVSFSRSAVCFLIAGNTLQLAEIGAGNTDCENYSITIKEL